MVFIKLLYMEGLRKLTEILRVVFVPRYPTHCLPNAIRSFATSGELIDLYYLFVFYDSPLVPAVNIK